MRKARRPIFYSSVKVTVISYKFFVFSLWSEWCQAKTNIFLQHVFHSKSKEIGKDIYNRYENEYRTKDMLFRCGEMIHHFPVKI